MPGRPQDRKSMLISEEAAGWLVCLRETDVGVSERRQYVRWLKQSPAHIAEMLLLSSVDGLLRNTNLDGISSSQNEEDREEASNVVDAVFPLTPADPHPKSSRPVSLPHQAHRPK
jgi:ferric-dicitrate binding protein FerR (iron transport regulator)